MMDSKLMSPREVADYIGLDSRTLANWRSGGLESNLPFLKIGGRIKYLESDVEQWLASKRVDSNGS